MDYFYKQPKYYSQFRCIGGDCPESCCDGWCVLWTSQEIDNLKSADVSAGLKERIDNSFSYTEEHKKYMINLCNDGRCPFHNRETDLCDIQHELGEKALSTVCGTYPRNYIENHNYLIRWCSTSCPAVIDLLFKDERATEIENIIARNYNKLNRAAIILDSASVIKDDPIKKKRIELFDFYTRILLNDTRSIETSIILTALAVKHLTTAEEKKDFESMGKIIHDLELQLNNPATTKSVDEIKPNYQLKFKLVNNMVIKFFSERPGIGNLFSSIHDGNELIVDKYLTGLEKFNMAFDNKDYILKNIIMNTFYDMNMPIGKLKRSLFENYAYFVLAVASIKTVAAAVGFSCKNIKDDFKICVSEMSRNYSHDIHKADAIAEDIKQMGLTSPAHLALIIKG